MKYLFGLGLLFSFAASANPITTPCKPADYQQIDQALSNESRIQLGKSLRQELVGLLQEEMGPVCNSITDLNQVGIPGSNSKKYEILGSGDRNFELVIVTARVEAPGTLVYISKK